MTLRDVLREAVAELQVASIPDALLSAEALLAHALGRDRVFLYTHPDYLPDRESRRRFRAMIDRRLRREPLQYITGQQEFYGRIFDVSVSVLIPRPETELIVETVLELNEWEEPRILDVGTGSGCIATTLALELTRSRVYASDVSCPALAMARHNAERHSAEVRLACADLLGGWDAEFDFIVSNPPYVHPDEAEGLQPELGYEPQVALFGSQSDPMILYEKMVSQAEDRLERGGYLVLEFGYKMADSVRRLLANEWSDVQIRPDLQGFPRVISARKG